MTKKAGLNDETLSEAKRLLTKGHSMLNTSRLLTIKYKRSITPYVLRYWLDEGFRERKRISCRKCNVEGRARDARRKSQSESKSPIR